MSKAANAGDDVGPRPVFQTPASARNAWNLASLSRPVPEGVDLERLWRSPLPFRARPRLAGVLLAMILGITMTHSSSEVFLFVLFACCILGSGIGLVLRQPWTAIWLNSGMWVLGCSIGLEIIQGLLMGFGPAPIPQVLVYAVQGCTVAALCAVLRWPELRSECGLPVTK